MTSTEPEDESLWLSHVSPATQTYEVHLDRSHIDLRAGTDPPLLDLLPVLLVSFGESDVPTEPKSIAPMPEEIRFEGLRSEIGPTGGWTIIATAWVPGAEYTLQIRNSPGDPQIRFSLEAHYTQDLLIQSEVLRFRTGPVEHAFSLHRDYHVLRVEEKPTFAGPLTPHAAFFNTTDYAFSFIGSNGIQGVWVRPTGFGEFVVDIEVDHQDNHPFILYEECVGTTGTEMGRLQLSGTFRHAGSNLSLDATWVMGDATPLRIGRYPRGFQAAIVFTDHADQSSMSTLEAFAFGSTGALDAGEVGEGYPGFVNRGLDYTKTIFLEQASGYNPQFEDPEYRQLLDAMVERGIEIGVHSPSGWRDRPWESVQLLAAFRRAFPDQEGTWIDHQPDTNCEAISNQGWDPDGEWYTLGLLGDFGFGYVWSGRDLQLWLGSLNLFAPENPSERRPIIYSHNRLDTQDDHSFVLFSSAWLFLDRERFLSWFSDTQLDRLQMERGLLIGHVYLDSYRESGRFANRTLLEPDGLGGHRIRPEVDDLFARFQRRQEQGDLWFTGFEALAEHMLPALAVRIEYLPGGIASITGPPGRRIPGLTLILPSSNASDTRIDGVPPDGRIERDGVLEFWFDLEAGQTRWVEVFDVSGRPTPLMQPAMIVLRTHSDAR